MKISEMEEMVFKIAQRARKELSLDSGTAANLGVQFLGMAMQAEFQAASSPALAGEQGGCEPK
jgi:hypothetical protein